MLFTCCLVFSLQCRAEIAAESSAKQEIKRYNDYLHTTKERQKALSSSEQLWQDSFRQRSVKFKQILERLGEIDRKLGENKIYYSIHTDYLYVLKLWRSFVEDSFDNISGAIIERTIPMAIPYKEFELGHGITEGKLKYINSVRQKFTNRLKQEAIGFELAQEQDSIQYTKILLYSGKLRSKLYQRLSKVDKSLEAKLSNEFIADFWREIHIIPLRWTATLYSKILEFRSNLHAGPIGYFAIFKEIMKFTFFIIFLISFIWFFKKLVLRCERIAEVNLRKVHRLNNHWILQYCLTILHKSIPWLLLLLGIHILTVILETTTLQELSELLPYIVYYTCYQLLLLITTSTITRAKMQNILTTNYIKQAKLLRSFISIYRFIFFNMVISHTVETVVGKAIVYGMCQQLFLIIGISYMVAITDRWRQEILDHVHSILPIKILNLITPYLNFFLAPVFSFIFFNIIVIHYIYVHLIDWLNQFDFSKRLSAKIFLAQIKKTRNGIPNKTNNQLPEDYTEHFNNQEIGSNIIITSQEFEECYQNISNWLQGRSAVHSMAIYGINGSGKSSFINVLIKKIDLNACVRIKLTSKITSANGLISQLKQVLGGDSTELDLLIKEWRIRIDKKIILCIDDAHHLFLSKSQGFDAIKTLMQIINADIENIFWCITFHSYSWSYISNVLDRYQCFDEIIELEPWSAKNIQTLITNYHKETKYELSFDDIFFALDKEYIDNTIEDMKIKFFEILWEQSNGNPSHAIRLWLQSLHYKAQNTIHVCLPPELDPINLSQMGDEVHFVCAAIIRHEVLSRLQIQEIMNQDKGVIARVLKICHEKKILLKDSDYNLRLNPDLSNNIIRTLKRKNYVY
ncbi:MAG: AAA family ATPase [Rickettsiaceae bacterium]